jgi:transposase
LFWAFPNKVDTKLSHKIIWITEVTMKARRKYDEQLKKDAVDLAESSEKPVRQIATDLGIRQDILYQWIRETGDTSKKAFTGNEKSRDEEMARLRKELAKVTLERDILKKAAAIFSVHAK